MSSKSSSATVIPTVCAEVPAVLPLAVWLEAAWAKHGFQRQCRVLHLQIRTEATKHDFVGHSPSEGQSLVFRFMRGLGD